jgi:hypothetical protein
MPSLECKGAEMAGQEKTEHWRGYCVNRGEIEAIVSLPSAAH